MFYYNELIDYVTNDELRKYHDMGVIKVKKNKIIIYTNKIKNDDLNLRFYLYSIPMEIEIEYR